MMISRFAVIAMLVAVVAGTRWGSEDNQGRLFDNYMSTYGRTYEGVEKEYRFGLFKKALAEIAELNANDPTAEYGINEFTDMTPEEFLSEMPKAEELLGGVQPSYDWSPSLNPADVPDQHDWRENGAVVDVKNQKQCGSCWAFATVASTEGVNAVATGNLVSLSEQQLVDCDKKSGGCRGGWMHWALQSVMENGGNLDTEASYPYKGRKGRKCKADKGETGASISGLTIHCAYTSYVEDDVQTDEPCDEVDLKATLFEKGPLSIALNANPMMRYKKGIMNPASCDPTALNHGVTLVGYGVEDGTDYWIIKNSWGTRWGEKGYCRILRGAGTCGLNTVVVSPNI